MRPKFYEKMLNSLEKVETITHQEKIDKADAIVAITQIVGKHNCSVTWNKNKWKVTPLESKK